MLMRSLLLAASSVLPLVVAAEGLQARTPCNADNCARAATGTRGVGQSSRLAACSSYQTGTATYVVSAATVTASPSSVPAFAASKCTREGSYASACSCAGVAASSTTILLYPSDTPCGGASSGPYQYICGYLPDPEANRGVAQNLDGLGNGSYQTCSAACTAKSGSCYSFLYDAMTQACTLYYYASFNDAASAPYAQRGAPQDIYSYLEPD